MMMRELPRFEPIGLNELRRFWKQYRGNAEVERMLLEIAQSRQTLISLERYFESVHKAWKDEKLGQLVAMEKMRLIFVEQNLRLGALAGLKPPPRKNEPDEPEPALVD
ncbi:hypothetical protein [Paraburkholderia sp. BCC1886]|uniref:hypothetical protein n=1 Tax=Paraburkholderia sp. BCC1886 TaxID=2562670 RepID=UPI001181F5E1|nr:hypothetical protein [Paraburkholderia sp. BCC1886]